MLGGAEGFCELFLEPGEGADEGVEELQGFGELKAVV